MIRPNRPYLSFPEPIPVPPNNRGDFCFTVDGKWKPYILGALFPLLAQRTWLSDDPEIIREAGDLLAAVSMARKCQPTDTTGIEVQEDCEMKLRICGGKLQVCDCGTWVDVPSCDGSDMIGSSPTQPGAGSPQPNPGGGSQRYCGAMSHGSVWVLPTPVSSGDQLLFSDLLGAWNDNSEIIWNCPDGWIFAAGACGETLPRGSPDPLPTKLHMSIIGIVSGTQYDVLNIDFNGTPQPFTVPSGISNEMLVLQANIDDLSRVQGEVTFCVTVTNNQTATDVAAINFRDRSGGFIPVLSFISEPESEWVPSQGFEFQDREYASLVFERASHSHKAIDSIVNTRVEMTYSLHKDTFFTGSNIAVAIIINNTVVASLTADDAVDGDDQVLIWNGSISVTDLSLFTACSVASSAVYGGSCAVIAVKAVYAGNVAPF